MVGPRPSIRSWERPSCPRLLDGTCSTIVRAVWFKLSGICNSSRVLRSLVIGADSRDTQSLSVIPRRPLTNGTFCSGRQIQAHLQSVLGMGQGRAGSGASDRGHLGVWVPREASAPRNQLQKSELRMRVQQRSGAMGHGEGWGGEVGCKPDRLRPYSGPGPCSEEAEFLSPTAGIHQESANLQAHTTTGSSPHPHPSKPAIQGTRKSCFGGPSSPGGRPLGALAPG